MKIYKSGVYCFLVLVFCFFYGADLFSQDLSKEVYVVSSYQPEIADVDKISTLPLLSDTFKFDTKIEYTVLPSRISSAYELREIKPAKMVGTPLDKLYNSHLKLGFGNYTTPLAEYSIQNLRSKEYAVGGHIFHKSSYHKYEPVDGIKIPAGYAKTSLSGYGKKFYRDFNLEGELGADRHRIRHYGMNTDLLPEGIEIKANDIKQAFNTLYGKVGVRSTQPDSAKLAYTAFLQSDYLWDHFKTREPHVRLNAAASFPVKSFRLGFDGAYDYYKFKNETDTIGKNYFDGRLLLSKKKEEWSINLGARVTVLKSPVKNLGYIFPDVNFSFHVIDDALSAIVGLNGYMEYNSYAELSRSNPFLIPGSTAEPTIHPLIAFVGLRGYLSRKASYRFDINWEAVENAVFFVNTTDSSIYQNQFDIVSDDADRIRYHFEFDWSPLSYLSFYLKSNVYNYKMVTEDHPWHQPNVDMTFTTSYNFKGKIYAQFDFIALGKRMAKNVNGGDPIELKPVYDLNLKLEYKYSNILSVFADFYNLTNQKQQFWNQYQTQGINILAGVSYKF